MNKEEIKKFMNQQQISNKTLEILIEQTRLAAEAKNEEIANAAVDAYTMELINNEVL